MSPSPAGCSATYLGYAPAVPWQITHIDTCSSHREGAVGVGMVRCITAQPEQGEPF